MSTDQLIFIVKAYYMNRWEDVACFDELSKCHNWLYKRWKVNTYPKPSQIEHKGVLCDFSIQALPVNQEAQ